MPQEHDEFSQSIAGCGNGWANWLLFQIKGERLTMAKEVFNMMNADDPSEIGQQFFYGEGRKKSYKKAFPYLIEAAFAGDPHCQNLVGYSYFNGLGVERNLETAVYWWEFAASNDDIEGLSNRLFGNSRGSTPYLVLHRAKSR